MAEQRRRADLPANAAATPAGLAHHVDQNADDLRDKFVDFEGKKELVVIRDDFVKGSPDNDWEGVMPEFAEQIAANTKKGAPSPVRHPLQHLRSRKARPCLRFHL